MRNLHLGAVLVFVVVTLPPPRLVTASTAQSPVLRATSASRMSSAGSSSAYAFKPGGSLKLKGDDGKKDKKK